MNKIFGKIFMGDKVIWMIFMFLCIISVIEVYSASSQLTYHGNYAAPVIKHMGYFFGGLAAMAFTARVPCRYFRATVPFFLLLSVVLLIGVYFFGAINGGYRWYNIGGVSFQPSEVAKGTLVLVTAQILSAMQTPKGADRKAMSYILYITIPIAGLIMVENLSTAVLLCAVIGMMMIIGRIPMAQIGKLLGVIAIILVTVFSLVMLLGSDEKEEANAKKGTVELVAKDGSGSTVQKKNTSVVEKVFHRFSVWKTRISKFADRTEVTPDKVDLINDGAQRAHANIAIVTSDIYGKGPGNSVECDFLSQAYSDFIYAIIIEEMGIEGALGVALLYVILLIRTGIIACRCENNFPAYLAMGLALMLVTQALFNMCVAVGVLPVTGQPLPLISKGGTSTFINCVYLGAILSISRTAQKHRSQNTTTTQTPQATVAAAA